MEINIGILNEGYTAEEEFVMYQSSGDPSELPDSIKEVMTVAEAEDLDGGDWITLVDGEIVASGGHTHPFLIEATDE